eukprot:m.30944 g.30944  ORF g.30944 m.30944 type:complete len:75 (+) comp9353_c0_seq1:1655-1879(+)
MSNVLWQHGSTHVGGNRATSEVAILMAEEKEAVRGVVKGSKSLTGARVNRNENASERQPSSAQCLAQQAQLLHA